MKKPKKFNFTTSTILLVVGGIIGMISGQNMWFYLFVFILSGLNLIINNEEDNERKH